MEDSDLKALTDTLPAAPPSSTVCKVARSYANDFYVWLECELPTVIRAVAEDASIAEAELEILLACDTLPAAQQRAKELAKELKENAEPLRAKAVGLFPATSAKYAYLLDPSELSEEATDVLASRVPKFFYFSSYDVLPGECDLTELANKVASRAELSNKDRTVLALLAHAGEKPSDFMDSDYDSRKAELQAASVDLSNRVFEYWKQNTDLEVVFDTDNIQYDQHPNGGDIMHRILKIELRDGRHGNVETNFSTRSTGFQWFFSFFAAFSDYQASTDPVIVLLDEPGTSLHGEAQKDFIRFVFGELGASKQTLYTTHSQYMVDPARYEKLRAVHDRATRRDPNKGVVVTPVDLSADRDTVLPVESALGYSISQHLFIGSGQHLTVEGSSDFVFLQRLTEHLVQQGKVGLDPRLAIIPVGGDTNMPAFVALLGRRLKVSALIDGVRTGAKIERVKSAARSNGVPEKSIVACSQVELGVPTNADIEDLFDTDDYLKLYNWAFNTSLTVGDLPSTGEPILRKIELTRGDFDHALPAHALTNHRDEFFASISSITVERFEKLFALLNATVQ